MRFVDRAQEEEPTVLHKRYKKNNTYTKDMTELERVIQFRNDPANSSKSFGFKRFKEVDVKSALERLFFGKCAYCESQFSSTQPVDVEHYRPKGAVAGSQHEGYWWLAMDWWNLLPSCIDCNRKRWQRLPNLGADTLQALFEGADRNRNGSISMGKATQFPLEPGSVRAEYKSSTNTPDSESRLLIDPTRDDPTKHLVFNTDRNDEYSLVYPKVLHDGSGNIPSRRGLASIQVYGLNRLGLVQARTRLLRDLEFLLEVHVSISEIVEELKEKRLEVLSILDSNSVLSDAEKSEIQASADSTKAIGRLERLKTDILDQIISKASPEEPYSELVKSWAENRIGTG